MADEVVPGAGFFAFCEEKESTEVGNREHGDCNSPGSGFGLTPHSHPSLLQPVNHMEVQVQINRFTYALSTHGSFHHSVLQMVPQRSRCTSRSLLRSLEIQSERKLNIEAFNEHKRSHRNRRISPRSSSFLQVNIGYFLNFRAFSNLLQLSRASATLSETKAKETNKSENRNLTMMIEV